LERANGHTLEAGTVITILVCGSDVGTTGSAAADDDNTPRDFSLSAVRFSTCCNDSRITSIIV
jgi:hypothetical protein